MDLKRREDTKITTWVNEKQVSDSNWEVYAEIQEDIIYFMTKNPKTNEFVKFKIEKSIIMSETETESKNNVDKESKDSSEDI